MIEHAYIHIPFCLSKCKYCDFVSGESLRFKDEYLAALHKEIVAKYQNEPLKTLYFGGGTPSLLEVEDIKNLISLFKFQEKPEITLEANPETVTLEKFVEFKKLGINRISLGVQTFNNRILKFIGRNHNKDDILNAIQIIKEAKFKNISIDLMYGLPHQKFHILVNDVEIALTLGVKHISAYGLTIHKGSYFYEHRVRNLPDIDMQANMLEVFEYKLPKFGFKRYEISNFAKKGYESIHNCAYWENKNYYGFGLGASGYIKNLRYKNITDLKDYIKNPMLLCEEDYLTTKETMENEIFLSLRLTKGLNIQEFNEKYNVDFLKKYSKTLDKFSFFFVIKNNCIILTRVGLMLSTQIMADFLED
jgi:oxygen-independent coproporphyrinogen-3 oxidase